MLLSDLLKPYPKLGLCLLDVRLEWYDGKCHDESRQGFTDSVATVLALNECCLIDREKRDSRKVDGIRDFDIVSSVAGQSVGIRSGSSGKVNNFD